MCNNCSKNGHVLHQCKLPIISCGIILLQKINNIYYYLMIRRKDSFGYIDFIYGKYNPNNLYQVQQKIDEMSIEEKKRLLSLSFDELWKHYKRIIKKPQGVIILFGQQPFTSMLISSNYEWFKYNIICLIKKYI